MSGLQRFEDEKRRIIESCFSKLALDGTLQESYITHLRIIEDAAFPSSPAPPDSDPAQKKPRTIIIAVRSSGRVRVHKARENANKTFSVGKTWQIDELSAIQSYTALIPRTPEEEQQKRWAGQLGFTVTLGKPYYWQADSPQERLFFIGSLVKIYRKYTGGSVPKLIGFEERDIQKILGSPKPSAPPSNQGQQSSPLVQRPAQSSSPAQPPMLTSQPSNYSLPVNGSVGTGPHGRIPPPRIPTDRGEPPSRPSTGNSGQPSFRQPRPQVSTPSFASGRPSTANSPLPRDDRGRGADPFPPGGGSRQHTPSSQRGAATDIPPDSSPPKRDEPPSLQPNLPPSLQSNLPPGLRAGSSSVASPASRFDRSGTPVSETAITPDTSTQSPRQQQTPADVPPVPSHPDFAPPERRRPPLNIELQRANSRDPSNMVPAPLATPSSQPGFMRPAGPPARSTDRPEALQPLRVGGRPGPATKEDRANQQEGDSPTFGAIPAATVPTGRPEGLPAALTVQAPPPHVQEPPKEETPKKEPTMDRPPTAESPEETRPGLGPMVKKKSKAEVASAFRKIASAAAATNGFKPRAGGAAERLRLAAMKSESSDGPDGITGVVPAPSLLRRETDESSRPGTADPVAQRNASLDLPAKKSMDAQAPVQAPVQAPNPEVTVTKAPEQRPEGVRQASEASQMTVQQPQPKVPEKKIVEPPKPKQLSEEMRNELESIDVDPRLLSGSKKAVEFVELLDDFGWRGEGVHTKSIEELNEDIERELNKAQVGGWFDKLDEEDERVEKLKGSLDSVIAECDELDGLLTLYGVELGTLSDDIAYIEAQSQGLQVHAANQKLLQSEIKKFIEQREFDKKQAEVKAELLRQRELQREASMRSTESPTSYGGESRDSLDERQSVDKGPLGSLRRREGLGSQSGDDEATKEKKKKIGAWKSVRKKFHAP